MTLDPRAIERELAIYYDAEGEARSTRPLLGVRLEARERFLSTTSGTVLEIGSGPGRDASAFLEAGLDYVAVDLSIEHARRCRATGAAIALATARHLPFPRASFDAVWSMSTLMHVPESAIDAVLVEVAHVLRPRGRATIGVWGGRDVEEYSDEDPPRLFSQRSVDRWVRMLGAVGDIESSETSMVDGDSCYHVVVVRRTGSVR